MVTAPVRAPVALGENVTWMLHEVATLSTVPQLLVWAKSPEATMELICSGLIPEVSVIACAWLVALTSWLPKASACGAATAVADDPRPLSPTLNAPALVTIDKLAMRVPMVVGVNTTLIVQLVPALTLVPQLLL